MSKARGASINNILSTIEQAEYWSQETLDLLSERAKSSGKVIPIGTQKQVICPYSLKYDEQIKQLNKQKETN